MRKWAEHAVYVGLLISLLPALIANGQTKQKSTDHTRQVSAEHVVSRFVQAIGGKKRLAAVRDSTSNWAALGLNHESGSAIIQQKFPSSIRARIKFDARNFEFSSGDASAWEKDDTGAIRTITGAEANSRRLIATLLSSHFNGLANLNVLMRSSAVENIDGAPNFVIEFTSRNGAMVRGWFDQRTSVLNRLEGSGGKFRMDFTDYRNLSGILEPCAVRLHLADQVDFELKRTGAQTNTGLTAAAFDPPTENTVADLSRLVADLQTSQKTIDERVSNYYFTQTETEVELNDKGDEKKRTVKVYEDFPVPGHEPVRKLVSENGIPLSPDRAAKEERRVGEELEKAERAREKEKEKHEKRAKTEGADKDDSNPDIATFLRVCELVSPRSEVLAGREVEVVDFRPKAGYKPANRKESLLTKLNGNIWIDPADKVVIRLEAKFAEGFKIGGGLVFAVKPGAAIVIEQTRMTDGVWLPKFAQVNLSYKFFLLGGGDVNATYEYSNYRKVSTEAKDYKIDAPVSEEKVNKKDD